MAADLVALVCRVKELLTEDKLFGEWFSLNTAPFLFFHDVLPQLLISGLTALLQ